MAQFGFEYLKTQFEGFSNRISEVFAKKNNVVTGVKGNKEKEFRKGEVDITADNIGAISEKYASDHYVPDYIKTTFFTVANGESWTRFAEFQVSSSGGYNVLSEISCTLKMKRGYNTSPPEYHEIKLVNGYGGAKFVNTIDYGRIFFKKIRVVWDASAAKYYLEVYYNYSSTSGGGNPLSVAIEFANSPRNNWMWNMLKTAITVPETAEGIEILAVGDMSKQFEIGEHALSSSRVTGNAVAINGKTIADMRDILDNIAEKTSGTETVYATVRFNNCASNWINLWDNNDTTTKISDGAGWAFHLIATYPQTTYQTWLVSSYSDNNNYIIVKSNGTWGKVKKIALEESINNHTLFRGWERKPTVKIPKKYQNNVIETTDNNGVVKMSVMRIDVDMVAVSDGSVLRPYHVSLAVMDILRGSSYDRGKFSYSVNVGDFGVGNIGEGTIEVYVDDTSKNPGSSDLTVTIDFGGAYEFYITRVDVSS